MENPKPNRLLNWSIILLVCALVAGPVGYEQLRTEIAQWHLAAAANAVIVTGTDPEPHLRRAEKLVGELDNVRDYWLFRIKQMLTQSPRSATEVLKEAVSADVDNAEFTGYIAASLWEIEEFETLIAVNEFGRDYFQTVSTSTLNQLAYARSLVSLDLHKGLEEINAAIDVQPELPELIGYRDTRAWVLFKMGRPLDAIEDIEFAIAELEKAEQSDWLGQVLTWVERSLPSAASHGSPDKVLTKQEAGDALWGKGALIYHRAKILDALGRSDRAQQDWQWLKEHRLPQDDRIY